MVAWGRAAEGSLGGRLARGCVKNVAAWRAPVPRPPRAIHNEGRLALLWEAPTCIGIKRLQIFRSAPGVPPERLLVVDGQTDNKVKGPHAAVGWAGPGFSGTHHGHGTSIRP